MMTNPHPAITFEVNLKLNSAEAVGPKSNSKDVNILHPDRHSEDQDAAVTKIENRKNNRSTWVPNGINISGIPASVLGPNRALKHGDQFTLYGMQALYVRDMYAEGYAPADRAWLTVV